MSFKLEKKFNISLPKEYRDFILNIGNGGAGTGYGLYSLEGALLGESDDIYPYKSSKKGKEISKNFIRPDMMLDDDNDDEGLLLLSQHGCGNDDFLIVAGDEKGFIWTVIEGVGLVPLLKNEPPFPKGEFSTIKNKIWKNKLFLATDDEKMRFDDWYKDWLEEEPYIYKIPLKIRAIYPFIIIFEIILDSLTPLFLCFKSLKKKWKK